MIEENISPKAEAAKLDYYKEKLLRIKSDFANNREAYGKIIRFGQELRAKYPDCEDYALFHVLIGSTPPEGFVAKMFDFPGDDSIANLIESL